MSASPWSRTSIASARPRAASRRCWPRGDFSLPHLHDDQQRSRRSHPVGGRAGVPAPGIGAFLNVCVGRLARIVDRSRSLEPRLLASRGDEHDRIIGELHLLDRRIQVVNAAVFLSVSAAVLICLVVVLLFAGQLARLHFGTMIALLFSSAMIATGLGFAVFLYETRLGTRAVRVRSHLLEHQADDPD